MVFNWTGANQAKALSEAKRWAVDQGYADGEYKASCKKHDSDHDGDVSCNVSVLDANSRVAERVTLECPTKRLVAAFEDSGCREVERFGGRVRARQSAP